MKTVRYVVRLGEHYVERTRSGWHSQCDYVPERHVMLKERAEKLAECLRTDPNVRGEVAVEVVPEWSVFRHSGRGGGPEVVSMWRSVFTGSEEKARERYRVIRDAIRQGGIRLARPDGTTGSEYGALRFRTRW